MKKTMKKMASIILFFFSFTLIAPNYSYSGHRFNDRGTTERWGNGGRWEDSSNEDSKIVGYIVFGVLFLATLGVAGYWLSTKGPDYSERNGQRPEGEWRNSSSSGEVVYNGKEKEYVLIKKDNIEEKNNSENNKKKYNVLSPF